MVVMFMPDGILRKLRQKLSAVKASKPTRNSARKISDCVRKISDSARNVNIFMRKVGDFAREVNQKRKANQKRTANQKRKASQNPTPNQKRTENQTKRSSASNRMPNKNRMPNQNRMPNKKLTPNQLKRRMYRRRRVIVATALIVILAIAVFCVVSLFKGLAAIGGAIAGHEVNISRKVVPDPRPVGLTPRCTSHDVRLELSTKSQTVPMGGSVELTERFVYEGNTSCLIDSSDMNVVLSVNTGESAAKSKQDAGKDAGKDANNNAGKDAEKDAGNNANNSANNSAVWRSDVCEVPLNPLLMAKGDHFEKKITWNTSTNVGKGCVDDDDLPKVDRGTYVLQLVHKRVPGLHSEPVLINVQ